MSLKSFVSEFVCLVDYIPPNLLKIYYFWGNWCRPWFSNEAFEADILEPAKDLRLNTNEEEEYESSLILEKCPKILVLQSCSAHI